MLYIQDGVNHRLYTTIEAKVSTSIENVFRRGATNTKHSVNGADSIG